MLQYKVNEIEQTLSSAAVHFRCSQTLFATTKVLGVPNCRRSLFSTFLELALVRLFFFSFIFYAFMLLQHFLGPIHLHL